MQVLHAVLFALGLSLLPAAATAERPAETHFFDASFGDLKEELALARKEGKQGLFLMFGAEDCPPCHWMKAKVLNQVEVQERFRRHFRVLYVDFNGDTEMVDLEGRTIRSKDYARKVARVVGTPTFTAIGLEGRELLRHFGPTRDAAEFMLFADYVASGAHRTQAFDAFRRERLAARR
jgi:thioredoxin-related protein